jgi:hypothetical protein
MIFILLSTALLVLASGAPDVRGEIACPSPEAVAVRLRSLLPANSQLPPGSWLEIATPAAGAEASDQIEVRMMAGAPPRALGVRRLSVPPSCDDAAQAVAVVAATWTANYLSPPPLWFGEATGETTTGGARAGSVDTSPPPFSPLGPAVSLPAATVAGAIRRTATAAAADREAGGLEIGAAFGAAASTAGTAAPFVDVEVDLRRNASAARLLVMAFGARTIDLGSGQVAWRRLMAGGGVAHAWGPAAAQVQVGGDIVAGATFLEGTGFVQNAASTSFDAGAGPWVRVAAPLAAVPVTVWVGAQGLAWVRQQRVRVDGAASSDSLPRLDLLVGAGLAWNPHGTNRPSR